MALTHTKLSIKRRVRIYKKAIEEKKEQLNELKDVDTPKSPLERDELQQEIQELEIKLNETNEQLETSKLGYQPDFFND